MSTREELITKLLDMQGGNCFICDKAIDLALHKVEVDHIKPRAKGGKDDENNYALTHEPCNRNKSDSDLRVARCMAMYEMIKDKYGTEGPNRPNLGDFLREMGGGKAPIRAQRDGNMLRYSLPDDNRVERVPIYADALSEINSVFLELPIECLHHDERINPRAVGSRIRGLIAEFLEGRPQLHVALGWAVLSGDGARIHIFDGQHKAVSQMLLGVRKLPVRVFLDADLNTLLEANTNAGTTLRQVAFDKATQRLLGSQIYWEKVEEYRKMIGKPEESLDFSEQDLVKFFKGEHREIRRYIVDDVRVGVIHHPENKLKDFVEFAGKSGDKPLSYSTIEKSFFSLFLGKEPLSLPIGFRLEVGENPRQLEKEQLVKLMNILAEELYIGKYDFDRAAAKVEDRLRKGEQIPDEHLRVVRMSREEVFYNWLRYVHSLALRYFLMRGDVVDEDKLFQRKFSEDLWQLIHKLVRNIAALPLWVNPAISSTVFGGKQDYEYWRTIFETGKTSAGQDVLARPLNLDELIR